MAKGMTQKQYARHRGVTPQYVNKLVLQGKIELNRDGRIDPKKADAVLQAWARPGAKTTKRKAAAKKAGKASAKSRAKKPRKKQPEASETAPRRGSATGQLTAWRAKEIEMKAKLAEIDLQLRTREALPRAEVVTSLQLVFKNFQTALRRLARALPPRLHGHVFAKQEEILLEDFDVLLRELDRDPLGLSAFAVTEPMPVMSVPPAMGVEGSVATL
jgi:hypothetical protein